MKGFKMRKSTGCPILLAMLFSLFSQSTFSKCCPSQPPICTPECGYFELIAGFGAARLNAGHPSITFPGIGAARLNHNNNSQAGDATAGIGYVFPLINEPCGTNEIAWLPAFSTQLNFHHISRSIRGELTHRSNPNHRDYDLDLNNNRLMFDFSLSLFTLQRFSVYAIAGAGEAWTRVGYNQRPDRDLIGADISLNSRRNSGFVSELGGGATLAVTNSLSVSLQYLYTNFYNVRTGNTGTLSGMPIRVRSTEFPFRAQEVFLLFVLK